MQIDLDMSEKKELDFVSLSSNYANQRLIPYEQLLNTVEWKKKRDEILKRDEYVCTKCKRRPTKVFTANQICDIFKIKTRKTEWLNVGNHLKLPGWINDGHYWFFSIETLNKFRSSYWDAKYLKYSDGESTFVLIKAKKRYFLHIHHKQYILDKLPWEYYDSDLQTICNWCHWELHEKEKVNVYRIVNGKLQQTNLTPCHRCKGAGWFPEYEHVESGICFRCLGLKFEELRLSTHNNM